MSQISVLVSQVFVLSSNLGSTIGPALSANLAHHFGFTFAMISYAAGTLVFAIISYVLTLQTDPNKKEMEKRSLLEEIEREKEEAEM